MNVYPFNYPHEASGDTLTNLLGGKGANLHRMSTELGLPVPEGFTISTAMCWTHTGKDQLISGLVEEVLEGISGISELSGRQFGDDANPLLVSVRSGAPVSMPGMMETILNLGLNDATVEGLVKLTNDRFAWDSYRRFLQMYGSIVYGIDNEEFTQRIAAAKSFQGIDVLEPDMIQLLVREFKRIIKNHGHEVPQDAKEQLYGAILAVFNSWTSDKAQAYREIEGIPHDIGTAVNVQRMVFGNLNDNSGTGVAFTRNPNTGENKPFGDFLVNAQGEDVVDGSHVTLPLHEMSTTFPDQHQELIQYMEILESSFHDMCDIEFTIEDGKLFMLQTRSGKRTLEAATRIAQDMKTDGSISASEAKSRIKAAEANAKAKAKDGDEVNLGDFIVITTGTPASPGRVFGKAVFSSTDAVNAADKGQKVILIRKETNPGDVRGMAASVGIITQTGGLVSHAAVVARGWGKPCVVSAEECAVRASETMAIFKKQGRDIKKGDIVGLDGLTGEIFIKK